MTLCVSIQPRNSNELKAFYKEAACFADLIEFRVEHLDLSSWDLLESYIRQAIPCILTHSNPDEALLFQLASFKPAYLDVPSTFGKEVFHKLKEEHPELQLIASFHDYEEMRGNFAEIFEQLRALPCDAIKMVFFARSTLDALKALLFLQQHSSQFPLSCFCMGEKGAFSRILQPIYGGAITYACLEGRTTAPGQISDRELVERYHFKALSRKTLPLALVGDPLDKSPSHITHNALFRAFSIDAVYVKIALQQAEFKEALICLRALQFHGLSVTMPLKYALEEDIPYNTVLFQNEEIYFLNTDAQALLDLVGEQMELKNKKITIIGAGATAHAIAEVLIKQGSFVTLCNRTLERARVLAAKIGGQAVGLECLSEHLQMGCDLLIQATSVGMLESDELPLKAEDIPPNTLGLDLILASSTRFLKMLESCGAKTISGKVLWQRQAAKQFQFWFKDIVSEQEALSFLEKPLNLKGELTLPPSKSQTLRAIVFATFATGISVISNPLQSPDTEAMINACRVMGATIEKTETGLIVTGIGTKRALVGRTIDAGSSGIVLRFVGAALGLFHEEVQVVGGEQLQQRRSCKELLSGLKQLGAQKAYSLSRENHVPISIQGPIQAASITIDGKDSQPVSGLLIACSLCLGVSEIYVKNAGEKPWVALTLHWLKKMGVEYEEREYGYYRIQGKESFLPFEYTVPGDLSSLAYFLVGALITPSDLLIRGVDLDDMQGDKEIISILESMGAKFQIDKVAKTICVQGPQLLFGTVIDVNNCIDAITILAVIGCFAEGETVIINGQIARDKESDRISIIAGELRKMGALIIEREDGLVVSKSELKAAELASHGDHRIAMSLAIGAMGASGHATLVGASCVEKSYPTFFEELDRLSRRKYTPIS